MSGEHLALSCGVGLDALARQVFDGDPPVDVDHQRRCAHCHEALDRIRVVAAHLDRVASTSVTVPPGLLRRVMARLRATPSLVTVSVSSRGITEVAQSVVARIARDAAFEVGGVEFASVLPSDRSRAGLRVRLVVAYGPSLHALADSVRDSVRDATASRAGVHIDQIDVSIDDLA